MCWIYIKRKLNIFKSKPIDNHDMMEDSDCAYNIMTDNQINNKLYMRKSCHIQNHDILDSLSNDNINILTYKNVHMSEDDLNNSNVKYNKSKMYNINSNVRNSNVRNNNVRNNNVKNNNVRNLQLENNKSKMYNVNIDYPCNYNNYEWNNFKIDYI
jgi:hypothetical protein